MLITCKKLCTYLNFNTFIIFYLWVDFGGMNMRRSNVGGMCIKIQKKIVDKRCVHARFIFVERGQKILNRNRNFLKVKYILLF